MRNKYGHVHICTVVRSAYLTVGINIWYGLHFSYLISVLTLLLGRLHECMRMPKRRSYCEGTHNVKMLATTTSDSTKCENKEPTCFE